MRKWIKEIFNRRNAAVSAPVVDNKSSVESLEGRQLFSAFGIDVNNLSGNTYGSIVSMMHDTGTTTARLWVSVNNYSDRSEQGVFKYIRRFHSDGFDTLVSVVPRDGLRDSYGAVNGYFSFLAGTLGGSVDRWEVGNEPDRSGWNMSDYVHSLLDPASAALHAHGEKVVSGGVSWNPADIKAMVSAGMLNDVDFVGYHPYLKSVGALQSSIAEIKSVIGSKPLIATEWNARGYESDPDRSAWANGIEGFWPIIRDNFYASYYFAAYKVNTFAGPAGLLTSGGGHNEPFYSTYKSLRFGGGGGSVVPPAPTPTPTPTPTPVPDPGAGGTGSTPSSTGKPFIAGFKIIDATTGLVIKGYENVTTSKTISLSSLPHRKIQIQALVTTPTSSVLFKISGLANRFENTAPFTAFVDSHGKEAGWDATAATLTLSATGYTADNGGGTAGNTLGLTLKFI